MADPAHLVARVEEQLLVRVFAAPRPAPWVSLYRLIALPMLRRGDRSERTARLGGRSWRVVCCGRPKRFRWLLGQLFDEVAAERALQPAPTTHPDAFEDGASDLVAVEVHPAFAERFREAGWMILPETVRWTRGVADPTPLAHGRRRSRALRSDLALIARLGYTMEESRSAADWDLFRDRMLLPYVRGRFGDDAWVPSDGYVRALASRGRLLFAVRDGRRVSAACVIRAGRRVWAPLMGVMDGSNDLLREGALAALYKFLLEWGTEQGADVVDIGRTRPSLADSIAWYKAKWGFRPTPDPLTHLVAVRLGPGASLVRDRLASRRILIQDAEGVRPLGAAEAPSSSSPITALTGSLAAQEE